jgi:sugar/nucleoside kinase (ribokinase family)
MRKILTLGSATQDIFILYEGAETLHLQSKKGNRSFLLLEAGVKVNVQQLHYATGGGATNTAVSFQRLGLHAIPCFKIGAGKTGEFILDRLKHENIDISHVVISPSTDTALSFIIPTPEKNYTALCYRGNQVQLQISDIPLNILDKSDCLYVTSLSGSSAALLPRIARKAQQRGITIAANPGTHQILDNQSALYEALSYLDILILNTYEARLLMGTLIHQLPSFVPQAVPSSLSLPSLLQSFMVHNGSSFTLFDYFTMVLQQGPRIAVVTDGAYGVYIGTSQTLYFHPSIPTKSLSAVGAGDAFGSTFVGCLALGLALEQAIVYGVINASSVLTHLDAKAGLLSLTQLEEKAQALDNKLQLFPLTESTF